METIACCAQGRGSLRVQSKRQSIGKEPQEGKMRFQNRGRTKRKYIYLLDGLEALKAAGRRKRLGALLRRI